MSEKRKLNGIILCSRLKNQTIHSFIHSFIMANNDQSNNNSHRRRYSYPDAQGHWYSHITSPSLPSLVMNMTATISSVMEISPPPVPQPSSPPQPMATDQAAAAPPRPPPSEPAVVPLVAATAVPTRSDTICISSSDDEDDNNNGDNSGRGPQHVAQMTSILPQEWRPVAASTPQQQQSMPTMDMIRTEQAIEQELFDNIQRLVQEFLSRPNRHYPYYRVMRWTIGDQPRIEHMITVVINQLTILL